MFEGWGRGKHKTQSPEWRCGRWNKKYAGHEACAVDVQSGYVRVYIFDKHYYAHRVIWVMVNGEIPRGMMIDHQNGDRSDNRLENLRLARCDGNAKNTKLPKDNMSGRIGVFWDGRRSKWTATIRNEGKSVYLGAFDDISLACDARAKAEVQYGYHENHGRVMREDG